MFAFNLDQMIIILAFLSMEHTHFTPTSAASDATTSLHPMLFQPYYAKICNLTWLIDIGHLAHQDSQNPLNVFKILMHISDRASQTISGRTSAQTTPGSRSYSPLYVLNSAAGVRLAVVPYSELENYHHVPTNGADCWSVVITMVAILQP